MLDSRIDKSAAQLYWDILLVAWELVQQRTEHQQAFVAKRNTTMLQIDYECGRRSIPCSEYEFWTRPILIG